MTVSKLIKEIHALVLEFNKDNECSIVEMRIEPLITESSAEGDKVLSYTSVIKVEE